MPERAAEPVFLVTATVAMDGAVLRALAGLSPAALVVAATGSGSTDSLEAARGLMTNGVPVALASRTLSGGVSGAYGFPGGGATWIAAGAMPCGTLSGPKSRVALAYGLGAGLTDADLRALMAGPAVAVSAKMIITGRIATLAGNDGFGWSEAVAIDGGRVVAAGSAADVTALAGPATERWDLGDRHVVVPGVTDAHLHLMTAAQEALEVDLHDAPDLDATFGRIRGGP